VDTIRLLKEHGFNGFLMGEAFMKEQDPGYAFEKFIKTLTD
jgi:indole-3-glycerol phosphate synthase